MIEKISKESIYKSDLGWLKSRFHFSFADYFDSKNVNYGVLRVLNDDEVMAKSGFSPHAHKDMEIVTYVIDGELTHEDSMGNKETLYKGEVQYMSAGEGIVHSEYNLHETKKLLFLQIWILPSKKNLKSTYGSYRYLQQEREDKLLHVVSPMDGTAKIKLHQDVNFYASEPKKDTCLQFSLKEGRQVYFILIDGALQVNNIVLKSRDAMKIKNEKVLSIKALENSHFLFIEMKCD